MDTQNHIRHQQVSSSSDTFSVDLCKKKFVYLKSLLLRLFRCLCILNGVVLGRFGVGRLQIWHVALSFLWQFLRWGQSQDARGCLAVTDHFWLGNKSNHHSHLLHHFFQSCFLIEDRKRKHNKVACFFGFFWHVLISFLSPILADLKLWIFRTYLISNKNPIFKLADVHLQHCFPPFNMSLFDPHNLNFLQLCTLKRIY